MSTAVAPPSQNRQGSKRNKTLPREVPDGIESVKNQLKAVPMQGSVLVVADHDITRLLSYAKKYAQSHPWVHVCLLVYSTGPREQATFAKAITEENGTLDVGNPLVPIYVWRSNMYDGFHALDRILDDNKQAQIVSDWRLLGDGYELTIPGLWRARSESRKRIWAFTTAIFYKDQVNTLGSQILDPVFGSNDEVSGLPTITGFTVHDGNPWDPFLSDPST